MEPLRLMRRWRKRLRALLHTQAVDRELDEEMAFHLDMSTRKNMQDGMTPEEAKRQAKLAFGAVPKHRGETREARWLAWFPDLSLDLRLGARMLVKYPGITVIGGFAMAFAIWVGCVTFEMVNLLVRPSLPLPGAEQIVKLGVVDVESSSEESQILHEFVTWRESLRSITDLGAYRNRTVNLIAQPGDARTVEVAEITATAFDIAPEPPLLGRALLPDDERAGASPVIVLGYDVWRTRFNSDSSVVGKTVQVDEAFPTIVGVMPQGFEFPVAHDAWTPLRTDALDRTPRAGPPINVFGRLVADVTREEAQTELTAIGQRMAVQLPTTHKNLQPRVVGYTDSLIPPSDMLLTYGIPLFAVALLILVCGNVALLMFARAATRESEMIVRSALGASRSRIVIQLFAEALVLGGVGAALGLAAAEFGLRQWGTPFLEANMGRLAFWIDVRLSPLTVVWAIGLTILAAVIAGVVPALKVTSGISSRLRQATAGAGGLKFGGVWTAVIITQIAFTTAFPAMLFIEKGLLNRIDRYDAGFSSEQYLSVFIEPDASVYGQDSATVAAGRLLVADRFQSALERLRQRALSQPEVVGVAFIDRLPREGHRESIIELDTVGHSTAIVATENAKEPHREVQMAFIDESYFQTVQAPILAGRAFQPADFVASPRVVIVDQGFVDQVLDGRNPIGRRFRYVDRWAQARGEVVPPQPWLEIVGAVKELGMGSPAQRGRPAGVYTPVTPGYKGPTKMIVHVRGDPLSFIPKVRTLATEVDPTLRLSTFQRIDQVTDTLAWVMRLWLKLTGVLTAIALTLSLAGIYAVMSFTVSRRTREIGIRIALGANARRVVVSIFKRPLRQVGVGVVLGALLGFAFLVRLVSCQDNVCEDTGIMSATNVMLLVVYAAFVLGVCLIACIVPTKRALSVQPTEALRQE